MNQRINRPALSLGNHIYLYQLLKTALGTGKQTFLPAVEEAFAAEQFTAGDLGFADTRALLEELSDFIDLKVFKGGRIYATVVAQPTWDEALAAASSTEKESAKAGGKSWKRKKSDKSLRPVRPRRVKRAEPEADKEIEAVAEEPAAPEDAAANDAAQPDTPAKPKPTAEEAASTGVEPTKGDADGVEVATTETEDAPAAPSPAMTEPAPEPPATEANKEAPLPSDARGDNTSDEPTAVHPISTPHISLTVVYDPGAEDDTELAQDEQKPDAPEAEQTAGKANERNAHRETMEHTDSGTASPTDTPKTATHPVPQPTVNPAAANAPASAPTSDKPSPQAAAPTTTAEPEPAAPRPEPAPEPAQREAPARAARPSAPVADYPVDFAREVYCPGDLLVALTHLLPYGADVLGILSAYFDIAKLAGTIEGGRTRATFPVGYIRDGERHEVGVTIKKRTGKAAAGCQTWAIAAVEHDAE